MSKTNIEIYKCDICGKITENIKTTKDWIHITHNINEIFMIEKTIVNIDSYITNKFSYATKELKPITDICSKKCLLEAFEYSNKL